MKLYGAFTAIVTPFNKKNEVDITQLHRLIAFQMSEKISGIVPCGTTGETPTLSTQEKKLVITETINQVNERMPVIAGTGCNDTQKTINFTEWAYQAGADAALVVTPYYNKPDQEGLYRHFSMLAAEVPHMPIVIYNVPTRTGVNIEPATVAKLERKFENIIGIKDASSNLTQVLELKRLCSPDFNILCGEDSLIVPYLASGASGVISVVSNIYPYATGRLVRYGLKGKFDKALWLQLKLHDVIKALFKETNPIPVKYVLNLMGFKVGKPRSPLHEIGKAAKKQLEQALNEFEK